MNNMKMRKNILLCSIGILLCVYIIQLIAAGRSSIKNITLKNTPVVYTMNNGTEEVVLTKDGDNWFAGKEKYKANASYADMIESNIKSIKVLDTVSHSDAEAVLERYELTDGAISVTASDSTGKVLRKLIIGKEATTGSQTYIKIDSSKDILLVSGSLKGIFGKSVDELRSKEVFRFDNKEISKVAVDGNAGKWSVEAKDLSAESIEWNVTGISEKLDDSKITTWVNSLPILNVESWGKTDKVPDVKPTTVKITKSDKTVEVSIYPVPDGENIQYFATSSETPYTFVLSKYMAEKFLKSPEDLK